MSTEVSPQLNEKCINTIRILAADTVQKANSGHPGAPMGCAPMANLLWGKFMKYSSRNPKWIGRDRFVLSNGHACALQYVMLHLTGYPITIEDLKHFRQVGSITPGHPENHLTAGVEVSTGPLGQGISNAVGLAVAESHLAATFNKPGFPIFDNFTYVICGDGCLQEGISSEASSLAGHLGLGKLIVLYDDNHITIDGETELSFTEDVIKRYEAYGWHTQTVAHGDDGQDQSALSAAIEAAKAETNRPSLIKVHTTIGFGSSKQGTEKVHGSPLGADDIKQLKTKFGFNPEEFFVVPADVQAVFSEASHAGQAAEDAWLALFDKYRAAHPDLAAEITRTFEGRLPEGWEKVLPTYTPADAAKATRQYSQNVLEKIVPAIPEFVGGSADLTPSTLTKVKGHVDYQKATPHGRYLRFGVREHAMCALSNGLAAYGGIIPFASTFLNFIMYAIGSVRLSALSHFRVVYIMTHDSIGVGEDGPTHQPIETLASLRSMPNMIVIRPADGNETSGAYKVALEQSHGPTVLALSRQNCDNLAGSSLASVALGAYVLQEAEGGAAQVILTASGSEVQLAVKAAATLKGLGVRARVVSFPSWELFERQSAAYRAATLVPGVPTLSIEAASTFGWDRYSHSHVGMHSFGASGPGPAVYAHFGITVDATVAAAQKLIAFYAGHAAPDLVNRP